MEAMQEQLINIAAVILFILVMTETICFIVRNAFNLVQSVRYGKPKDKGITWDRIHCYGCLRNCEISYKETVPPYVPPPGFCICTGRALTIGDLILDRSAVRK